MGSVNTEGIRLRISQKIVGDLKTFYQKNSDFLCYVLGMCLTAGTFAAIVGTVGTGFFVELLGSFQGFILLTAVLYLLSALFFNIYSTGERVDFDTTGPSSHLLFLSVMLFAFRVRFV